MAVEALLMQKHKQLVLKTQIFKNFLRGPAWETSFFITKILPIFVLLWFTHLKSTNKIRILRLVMNRKSLKVGL